MVRLVVIALVVLLAGAGCSSRDTVAFGQGGTGPDPFDAGPQPAYCRSDGPPLPLVGDGLTIGEDGDGNPTCSGEIAVYTFQKALCTCDLYRTATPLVTESFDSDVNNSPTGADAPVGIGGAMQANGKLTIGGSLLVAGTGGALLRAGTLGSAVSGDLAVNGLLGEATGELRVGKDAAVNGAIELGDLQVTGTLTVPDATIVGANVSAGAVVSGPVTVEPPCACGDDDLVNIEAFVSAHEDLNDNAEVPAFSDGTKDASGDLVLKKFSAGVLSAYAGDPEIKLPCGRFYLDGISGNGTLNIRVEGRAALLIRGDVVLTNQLIISLAEGAELDLMIAGDFSTTAETIIGSLGQPRRTRMYVGGTGPMIFAQTALISANIYAPRALLQLTGTGTVFGSLFVGSFEQAADLKIRYDVAVRRLDTNCIE